MIDRLVDLSLRKRLLVCLVTLFVAGFGGYTWTQLQVEAYPDVADVSSQVITQAPGLAAEEVEQQITIPLERELNGTPGLAMMRSRSTFGLSLITLVFRDGAEDYWSRQRILERVANVTLPPGISPGLDPLTSPIGEVYRYTLDSPTRDLRELSETQRWIVIPAIKQVPGIADVTNFGGITTQFLLEVDPTLLLKFNLSLKNVTDAISANSANAGGSVMVRGEQGYVVRGIGLVRSLQELGDIMITQKGGVPVFLRELGALRLAAQERHGILGKDDRTDGISGIVLLLRGENPSRVMAQVHAKIDELNTKLADQDTKIVPYLDRTGLVDATIEKVGHTVLEGISLVTIVLFLFLGSVRSALIVAVVIPMAMTVAFILMKLTHIPANLLSLGAIDFGIIVDGAIVITENILRLREEDPQRRLTIEDVREVTLHVAKPVFFATLIIITAYLPLFSFERVEAKLFSPMAYAVGYSLFGALLFALVLIPGLAYMAYAKPMKMFHNPVLHWLSHRYDDALKVMLRVPAIAVVLAAVTGAGVVGLGATVGREFLPELDEGSIWLQVQLPSGIALERASEMAGDLRRAAREFEEISAIVTQLGRNDDGTDPFTPSHIESAVVLKPYDQWPAGETKQDLIQRMTERFERIPGMAVGFSQPMIDGVNDKISGAHSELVVKVFGDDFREPRRIAEGVRDVLTDTPGAVDVALDQEPPLPQVQITIDRDTAARYGINIADIASLIQVGIGGQPVSQVFLGEKRYDVTVRYPENYRSSPETIGNLLLSASNGAQIPLSQLADIRLKSGESTITREANRRHLTVKLNLRNATLSTFVEEAQKRIAAKVQYDSSRYEIRWGGQFENQARAQQRMMIVLVVVICLMLVLLYGQFGLFRHALLILTIVPLAMFGGLVALHLRDMTLNVASAVGFIALFGVAVQNGVIMVANLNRVRETGLDLMTAVRAGAHERFRPVLMTASVATLGMLPAAMATGIGSDVQRDLATVVVGGLVVATLLTLFVVPTFYYLIEARAERRERARRPLVEAEAPAGD
ncbi:MAG: efflux RND transporter permease subunit [Alphaproteobacteria bacterium]|nr:efflux RND transporter permease subunit [Alphaproteobacteria bacterium]